MPQRVLDGFYAHRGIGGVVGVWPACRALYGDQAVCDDQALRTDVDVAIEVGVAVIDEGIAVLQVMRRSAAKDAESARQRRVGIDRCPGDRRDVDLLDAGGIPQSCLYGLGGNEDWDVLDRVGQLEGDAASGAGNDGERSRVRAGVPLVEGDAEVLERVVLGRGDRRRYARRRGRSNRFP